MCIYGDDFPFGCTEARANLSSKVNLAGGGGGNAAQRDRQRERYPRSLLLLGGGGEMMNLDGWTTSVGGLDSLTTFTTFYENCPKVPNNSGLWHALVFSVQQWLPTFFISP